MSYTEQFTSQLPYWNNLTESEKALVSQNAVVQSYPKGTFLQGCGASCLGMIYLLRGSVRVLMISEEGREITLFRLKRGDSCVLSASCVLSQITFETQMAATEETEILIVNSGIYGQLMESNLNVKCFSYELALERFSTVIWVMQQIIFARFDQRLATFLLTYYERSGKTELKMTQEAIAQEVNTAREVVARMLRQFASDGLVTVNRGTITLQNIEALKMLK